MNVKQPQYSIGAVTKKTGVSAHTLRKWESRHGLVVAKRSSTGHRIYSQQDIELIAALKVLVDGGHAIRHLAEQAPQKIIEQADQFAAPVLAEPAGEIWLFGPYAATLLLNERKVVRRDSDLWHQQALEVRPSASTIVVVEEAALSKGAVSALIAFAQHTANLIVLYNIASRAAVAELRSHGIDALPMPVTDNDIARLWRVETVPQSNRPQARFNTEELVRIANIDPGLQCECPNHIAKLLIDISAFERYSDECHDEDPAEAALHARLALTAAQARALFEDALLTVASADGLQLNQS